jgi:hypothetical protein
MNTSILALGISALCAPAFGQVFKIWAEAPDSVISGDTYTVEFWGSVAGDNWYQGISGFAGFSIDAVSAGDIAQVTTASIAQWASNFGTEGTVNGAAVEGISGGQLPNGFGTEPFADLSNPIVLFTIEVTAGSNGAITYTPSNPGVYGGLSYYPDAWDGYLIVAPDDPGTTLLLVGATTRVVPAPAAVGLVGFAGLGTCRQRGRSNARKEINQ